MLLGHKLVNAAQTKIILSNIGFNKSGITPERILNCFNFKMFLSTRVLSDATQQVYVVPLADISMLLDSRLARQGGFLKC